MNRDTYPQQPLRRHDRAEWLGAVESICWCRRGPFWDWQGLRSGGSRLGSPGWWPWENWPSPPVAPSSAHPGRNQGAPVPGQGETIM